VNALGHWTRSVVGRWSRMGWPLHPWQSVVALALLGGAALVTAVVSDLQHYRERELEAARVRSQDIARMLEAQTLQSLRRVDLLMQHAAARLSELGDPAAVGPQRLREVLQGQLPVDRLIRSFTVLGRDGGVMASTIAGVGPGAPALADRDYFVAQRDHDGSGLFIGASTIGRLTGELTLPVSVRLNRTDQNLSAVLVGAIDPRHFQAYYDSINRGVAGSVAVIGRNGSVFGRSPFDQTELLRNWSDTPLFAEELPRASIDTVRRLGRADGEDSIYSYRSLPQYPAVVVASLSVEEAMAPWRREVRRQGGLTLAGMLLLGLLTWMLARQLRSSQRIALQLRDSEMRWKFAIEGAGDGLWDWDIRSGGMFISDRWKSMLGFEDADIGHSVDEWRRRVHPDDLPGVLAAARAHLSGLSPHYASEHRLRCKDGKWKWVLARGLVVARDANGAALRMLGTHADINARKQAEESLEQSRERVRALSDVAFEAVFLSVKGICLEQNQQAQHMFGWTADEASGRPGIEWIAEQDRALVSQNMRLAYEQPYEVTALRKDGSTFPALIRARTMVFRGEPVRVTSVLDISEIKEAQAESVSTQSRMQATLDALPDLLFEVDADGRILNWHAARSDLLAVSPADFLGRRYADVLPSHAARACDEAVREALASGSSRGIQYSLAVPQGLRWFELSAAPMDSQGGAARHVIMLARDITERRSMEDSLRQRELYQRALLDNFPFQVWLKDELGRYLAVNERFAQVFGFSDASAVPGKTDADLFPADVANRYRDEDSAVMASGKARTMEELIEVQGTPGCFETYKSPLLVDGKAMGTVGFSRDISERRQNEEFRRQQVLRIEYLSHRLVRAQEEMRRRFASELHDRTSPNLAALRINLDFIASASPERRLGLGFEERVIDTRALIEDTTASIREICADLHPSALEGAGLVGAVRGYAYQFGRRTGLQVAVHCRHAQLRLAPDLELAMFRIVQEAMTNSAKHAQARRLDVTIELAGHPARVSIADDGVGIRADLAGASAGLSGLGLQTMRETAEFVGGRLSVYVHAGGGTQVDVEIDGTYRESSS